MNRSFIVNRDRSQIPVCNEYRRLPALMVGGVISGYESVYVYVSPIKATLSSG